VIVPLKGVEHPIEGLMNGTVDVSHTAMPYLIHAVLSGSDANEIFTLLAKARVKSYADLKGKLIAMSLPQNTVSIATRCGCKPAITSC
jgi:ABC-type nitrate/sulfonate/bicarbonate transport system substrate-binding protein